MRFIYMVIQICGRLVAFLCPRFIYRMLRCFRNNLYTGYVRGRFAHFGHSVIQYSPHHMKGEQFIHIGDNNVFEPDLQLTAWNFGTSKPQIHIGNGSFFRRGCHITAVHRIVIGDDVLTGTNVLITDNSHGRTDRMSLDTPPNERPIVSKGDVVIGNRVWLGNNVCVLPGVTIGDGAIVGANAVITHDVPPYTVAVGNPAHIVRH